MQQACARLEVNAISERSRIRGMSWLVAAATFGPLAWALGILWPRGVRGEGTPSIDFHAYHGPVIAYTQRAWRQGRGLLWDDLQNAGQV